MKEEVGRNSWQWQTYVFTSPLSFKLKRLALFLMGVEVWQIGYNPGVLK